MTLSNDIYTAISNTAARSAWSKGVKLYALELLENVQEAEAYNGETYNARQIEKALLNGASSWAEYSWGGCSLIYDADICERLATPSEQKKTRNGQRRPNANEEWLDTQARALRQAARLIMATASKLAH